MTTRIESRRAAARAAVAPARRLEQYRWMLLGRLMEDRLRSCYRQGMVAGGVYLGTGQEALSAAAGLAVRPGPDVFAPLIRDMAGRLAFGEPLEDAPRTHLGRVTGPMSGRDGNVHRGRASMGLLPMLSHLGTMLPTASGWLIAERLAGRSGGVGVVSIGDGAMGCGATHEGINTAAVMRLPLVVVVANNGWSYSTPNSQSFACEDLVQRAAGYGVAGWSCDGTDPLDCLFTVQQAVDRARAGGGTQLVVARLTRIGGHGEHDDARYIPEAERAAAKDCLEVGRHQLIEEGLASAEQLDRLRADLLAELERVFTAVEAEPTPDPAQQDWTAYSHRAIALQPSPRPDRRGASYAEALRAALDDCLALHPGCFIIGEDVAGVFGGAFKITKGLAEKYPDRVMNTPIAEDSIAGIAVGAAQRGCRPIAEFQFADFSTVAFTQMANHAGSSFWRAGTTCPTVFRLPVGGTPGGGPFHSQMVDGWLCSHPGLVVVAPATVGDAYRMLRQSVACEDPVIFCEHKFLYEGLRDPGFSPSIDGPGLCQAVVRRAGRDCTIVSWSAVLHDCLRAADDLERVHGVSVEVIDLRCLKPVDLPTIVESVSRTGRLVVVSETWPYGATAAEICARVSETAFAALEAPPRRICARETPIPYHPDLWAAHRPDVNRIIDGVIEVVGY